MPCGRCTEVQATVEHLLYPADYDAEERRAYVKIDDIFGRHVESKEAPEGYVPKEVKPKVGVGMTQAAAAPKITNVSKPAKPAGQHHSEQASGEVTPQERLLLQELSHKLEGIRALVSQGGDAQTTVHQIRTILGLASYGFQGQMDIEAIGGQPNAQNHFGSGDQSEYDQANELVLE